VHLGLPDDQAARHPGYFMTPNFHRRFKKNEGDEQPGYTHRGYLTVNIWKFNVFCGDRINDQQAEIPELNLGASCKMPRTHMPLQLGHPNG
jgi:hypothetical protein